MQLKDKAVLVTGAASGLGAATAIACAREGAKVWMVDRDAAGLEATGKQIAEAGGTSGRFVADLAQRQACFDAVENAINGLGRLDGLANVAGLVMFHRVLDVTEEEWRKIQDVVLSAPFYMCQAAIPELLRNHGSIVNVASAGGIRGSAYIVPYTAAKAGVIQMTRSMAMEFSHEPIRINCLAPGGMKTNIMGGRAVPQDLDYNLINLYAGQRPPADPPEIANMIVYMLSDATPFMHGAVVSVDGGATAG